MPSSNSGGPDGLIQRVAAEGEVGDVRWDERIGPYIVDGIIGQGSMGIVFDARAADGQRVALKTVRPPGTIERAEQVAARFTREARILKQLDHPGIVRLIDSGRDGDVLYLAMERVEGISLLSVRRQGPLGFDPLIELGIELALALAHLHDAGVIHRDIKPANILIRKNGQPVITDFGISGLNEATDITRQGDLLGSPGFMAPEVVHGRSTSAASDQYSLGRLLFELGAQGDARRLPRDRPLLEMLAWAMQVDWQRLPTDQPWGRLRAVLMRMMATEPEDRYPDTRAVAAALGELKPHDGLETATLGEHIERIPVEDARGPAPVDDLRLASPSNTLDPPEVPMAEPTVALPGSPADIDFDDRSADATRPALRLPGTTRVSPDSSAGIPLNDLMARGGRRMRAQIVGPQDPAERPAPASIAPPSVGVGASAEPAPDPSRADVAGRPPRPGRSERARPERKADEIARLTQANRRLREELAAARRATPVRRRTAGILALATFAAGTIIGALTNDSPPVAPTLVIVPTDLPPPPVAPLAARSVVPTVEPTGVPSVVPSAAGAAPSMEQDRRDAREMRRAAHEHLRRRDIDASLRLFRLCIEIADLPACHRDLASVLTLIGDNAAREHLLRYLALAPNAPDAAAIRAALQKNSRPAGRRDR